MRGRGVRPLTDIIELGGRDVHLIRLYLLTAARPGPSYSTPRPGFYLVIIVMRLFNMSRIGGGIFNWGRANLFLLVGNHR